MLPEPAFYQHETEKVFKQLIKKDWVVEKDACDTPQAEKQLTYEEENALRYVGG